MSFDNEAFEDALFELSQNSRPIITTLTEIAKENIEFADQIVLAIEARIHNVKIKISNVAGQTK
jgi:hypothetical protein